MEINIDKFVTNKEVLNARFGEGGLVNEVLLCMQEQQEAELEKLIVESIEKGKKEIFLQEEVIIDSILDGIKITKRFKILPRVVFINKSVNNESGLIYIDLDNPRLIEVLEGKGKL